MRYDVIALMFESPNSTLHRCKAWWVWLLVASCSLAMPGSTQLRADDDALFEPTWRRGLSQWTGSGYELPVDLPEPKLSDTPSNPLPYTMPVDPNELSLAKRRAALPDSTSLAEPKLAMPKQLMGDINDDAPPYSAPWSAALTKEWESTDKSTPQPAKPKSESIPALPPPAKRPEPGLVKPVQPPQQPPRSFSDRISSGNTTGERAPLEPQVMRWYQYPRRWIRGWDSHAEIGLNGSEGNATALALQSGLEMRRRTELFTMLIDLDYRQARSRTNTVEDNGRLNVDFDRRFKGKKLSVVGLFGLEYDRFKAFDYRLNITGAFGYHWIQTPNASLVTYLGGGASREFDSPNESWVPEGVVGMEGFKQLTARQKLRASFDYFPAWENFGNYRLVGDLSWEMLLDGTRNLSIRIAATDRYDSTPQGAKPNDVYYSSLLLYKF